MSSMDAWQAYLYPGSHVLRNKQGIRDAGALQVFEDRSVEKRSVDLALGRIQLPETFDLEHLRRIHFHLFQDVYEWAGELRTVTIAKGLDTDRRTPFRKWLDSRAGRPAPQKPFARPFEIAPQMEQASEVVRRARWDSPNPHVFASNMAAVYAHLNHAHPFREGNGRAGKMFLHFLSRRTPFRLDLSRLEPEFWNGKSSASSRPSGQEPRVDPDPLRAVFEAAATPRD